MQLTSGQPSEGVVEDLGESWKSLHVGSGVPIVHQPKALLFDDWVRDNRD